VTEPPTANGALQAPLVVAALIEHVRPPGTLVTVPGAVDPAPACTASVTGVGTKTAPTVTFALGVTVHVVAVPAAAHAPAHPAKVALAPAVATSVAGALGGTEKPHVVAPCPAISVHGAPLTDTDPAPAPLSVAVSVTLGGGNGTNVAVAART
jgi:hypothetical protein